MPRKKTKSKEEILERRRLAKRKKYEELKKNPELYAIEKEKERQRYIKRKKQKKLLSISEKTNREQREQRKRWRKNSKIYQKSLTEKKKVEEILVGANFEQEEDNQNNTDPLEDLTERQKIQTSRNTVKVNTSKIRKIRYSFVKQKTELEDKVKHLQRTVNLLRQKIKKLEMELAQLKQTPGKKVDALLDEVCSRDPKAREEVKKKLLFQELVKPVLKESYVSLRNRSDKRRFTDGILKDKQNLKKYKILTAVRDFTSKRDVRLQINNSEDEVRRNIQSFFEQDSNSRMTAGKKEFITKKGERKQKRFLIDNLKNLHKKFSSENDIKVSYSYFCKNRPFWVLFPKNQRDTCLCKLHCNTDLLIVSLNRINIIKEKNVEELLESICCDKYNERCLARECYRCKNRNLEYNEFTNDHDMNYFEWGRKTETYRTKDGIEKTAILTTKTQKIEKPRDVVMKLQNIWPTFLNHCRNIVSQYLAIKKKKESLHKNEALIHFDFSENYACKFAEEIQSFHFGGSRKQITLHTSVIYFKDNETGGTGKYPMCTLSESLRHEAAAVWAHIAPILKLLKEKQPQIDILHFVSDSPSSQYRNKFMFHIITQLHLEYPGLNKVTWNYQEAGHGKGAPDGIGAVLKRTADQLVKYGCDIGDFDKFTKALEGNVNITLKVVTESDITLHTIDLQCASITPVPETLKVHQVIWDSDMDFLTFRKLSCFKCEYDKICSHRKHLKFVNINNTAPRRQPDLDILSAPQRPKIEIISNVLIKAPVPAESTFTDEQVSYKPIEFTQIQANVSTYTKTKELETPITHSHPSEENVEMLTGKELEVAVLNAIEPADDEIMRIVLDENYNSNKTSADTNVTIPAKQEQNKPNEVHIETTTSQKTTRGTKRKKLNKENIKCAVKENTCICIYCTGEYIEVKGQPIEDWIQCSKCMKWSHEKCTAYEGSGLFFCDICN